MKLNHAKNETLKKLCDKEKYSQTPISSRKLFAWIGFASEWDKMPEGQEAEKKPRA